MDLKDVGNVQFFYSRIVINVHVVIILRIKPYNIILQNKIIERIYLHVAE